MRLKGTIIVEDSVIIPLFSLIIIALAMTCLNMHDALIKEYAYIQAAMNKEQKINEITKEEEQKLFNNVKGYIDQKTMTQNVKMDSYNEITSEGVLIDENNQMEFIRKLRALDILKKVVIK